MTDSPPIEPVSAKALSAALVSLIERRGWGGVVLTPPGTRSLIVICVPKTEISVQEVRRPDAPTAPELEGGASLASAPARASDPEARGP